MSEHFVEFAASSNGGRWFYGRDEDTGEYFVEHRANVPSGGAVTRTEVAAFLNRGPIGPEHEALRLLIASAEARTEGPERSTLDLS
jgi:hypothetical protein